MMSRLLAVLLIGSILPCAGVVRAESAAEFSETDGEWVRLPAEIAANELSASNFADALLKGLSYVELKKGYVSPIGQEERAKIVKSVTARHGFIWVPRKLSTLIGRLEELLKYVKKIDEAASDMKNAFNLGKMIGIALGAGSLDEAVDLYVAEGMYQNSPYGEAAYWVATVTTGMMNGQDFTEAIISGYDEKNIGLISKLGYAGGSGIAWLVQHLPWKEKERERAGQAFLDSLIAKGLNEKGQAIIRQWLKLDDEHRAMWVPKLGPEYFSKPDDPPADPVNSDPALPTGDTVCYPGDGFLYDGTSDGGEVSPLGIALPVDFVGFEPPYRRALYLFSGDCPSLSDFGNFYDSVKGVFTGDSPLKGDLHEYRKMWESTKEELRRVRNL